MDGFLHLRTFYKASDFKSTPDISYLGPPQLAKLIQIGPEMSNKLEKVRIQCQNISQGTNLAKLCLVQNDGHHP